MKRYKILGVVLIAWLAALIVNRFQIGLEHNLWWLSHASLLLASVGFFTESKDLITASLCMVFIPHLLWIIDMILLLSGLPTFGVGDYMRYADLNTYIFTIHHVFLIPLLLWGVVKLGVSNKGWLYATAYFAFITLGAILTTPAEYNVNCAFRVCEATIAEPVYFLNQLPPFLYWIGESVIMAIMLFLPVNSALTKLIRYVKSRKTYIERET